jgi:transposase
MKIVHTMASDKLASIPKRRSYSPELKSQVVTQTQVPGASVAGVALAHGINANIVHRWLRERSGQPQVAQSGFVALSLSPAKGKLAPLDDDRQALARYTVRAATRWHTTGLLRRIRRSKNPRRPIFYARRNCLPQWNGRALCFR